MTPAERLRAAATRLRDDVVRAKEASDWDDRTPTLHRLFLGRTVNPLAPSEQEYLTNFTDFTLALALADWLDDLAAGWPWDDDGTCVWDDGTPMRLEESPDAHALAVADAVLGGERS